MPDGFWLTEDKATILEIGPCEQRGPEYCGFVRALPGARNDSELARYENELCGLPLLYRVVSIEQNSSRYRGKLFDPETEYSYHADLKLSGHSIEVRVYENEKISGKTLVWTRVPRPDNPCGVE